MGAPAGASSTPSEETSFVVTTMFCNAASGNKQGVERIAFQGQESNISCPTSMQVTDMCRTC